MDGDGDTATASVNLLGLNSVATFAIGMTDQVLLILKFPNFGVELIRNGTSKTLQVVKQKLGSKSRLF